MFLSPLNFDNFSRRSNLFKFWLKIPANYSMSFEKLFNSVISTKRIQCILTFRQVTSATNLFRDSAAQQHTARCSRDLLSLSLTFHADAHGKRSLTQRRLHLHRLSKSGYIPGSSQLPAYYKKGSPQGGPFL